MQPYSIFSVLRESLRGHRGWAPTWREAEPKPDYDIIIIGGGGHGLATAYYLAKQYHQARIAVVEKGWIGGGNVGGGGVGGDAGPCTTAQECMGLNDACNTGICINGLCEKLAERSLRLGH